MDWEKIWYQHWQEIYRYVFFRTRDRHEAEDLTQETFMRAMKAQTKEITSTPALLKTIARNLVIDRWRKTRGNTHQSLDQQESLGITAKDPTQAFEILEQQDEIARVLVNLTPDQQQVIKLRIIKGLSVRETSVQMGKSEGAVKTLQFRALAAIREQLSSDYTKGEDKSHGK